MITKNKSEWISWFDKLREYEVLVMLAIARKKYNEKLKSEEVVFREVVTKENWERKYKKLITLVKHYPSRAKPEDYSVYITYNPRSVIKAVTLLKIKLAEWEFNVVNSGNITQYLDYLNHLKKFDREFISCLQKPEARSRRWHFLIDVDDMSKLELVRKQIEDLKLEVCAESKTKNGMHILVKPFNIQLWKPIENVELKRDGLFHIYHTNENEQEIDKS